LSTYYPGTEDDPRWKQLSADDLEARIRSAKNKRYRQTDRQRKRRLDHYAEMRERLAVLRAADRAERPPRQPAAGAVA
jgi:hypothetical protein